MRRLIEIAEDSLGFYPDLALQLSLAFAQLIQFIGDIHCGQECDRLCGHGTAGSPGLFDFARHELGELSQIGRLGACTHRQLAASDRHFDRAIHRPIILGRRRGSSRTDPCKSCENST